MYGSTAARISTAWLAGSLAALAQTTAPARVTLVDGAGAASIPVFASPRDPASAPRRGPAANEAAALEICLHFVEAQWTWSRSGPESDGGRVFAGRIRSSPGRRDGLYWPLDASGEESPLGPRFAAAAIAETRAPDARPLFGYWFKLLPAPSPDGRPPGFVLLAWPAEHGVSGVRSFLVTHLGDVFAKDLGPDTRRAAPAIGAFDPDSSWSLVATYDSEETLR